MDKAAPFFVMPIDVLMYLMYGSIVGVRTLHRVSRAFGVVAGGLVFCKKYPLLQHYWARLILL